MTSPEPSTFCGRDDGHDRATVSILTTARRAKTTAGEFGTRWLGSGKAKGSIPDASSSCLTMLTRIELTKDLGATWATARKTSELSTCRENSPDVPPAA